MTYRYFLAFLPDPALALWLHTAAVRLGVRDPVAAMRLHLTLCVFNEPGPRDPVLVARIRAALSGALPSAAPIRLGLLRGGQLGPMGRRGEIAALFAALARLLAAEGLVPLHRTSGLNPHISLSYQQQPALRQALPLRWLPRELVLIESWVGASHYEVLERWTLPAPVQGEFAFASAAAPVRLAA